MSTDWSAGRYEAVAERIAPIAVQVVGAVDKRLALHDATVVDLACGTGTAALAAASVGARVTGVDLTPELIAIARTRPDADAVRWMVADASETGLPNGDYDAVVSNMGIIFVEPTSLVCEVSRLLRPGGVFGFSAWVPDPSSPFFAPVIDALGGRPAATHTPDQWGDPALVHSRLAAGFDEIGIDTGSHTWQFDAVESALHFLEHESPMHVNLLAGLEETPRTRLLAAFEAALTERADRTGRVAFVSPYLVVTARRR